MCNGRALQLNVLVALAHAVFVHKLWNVKLLIQFFWGKYRKKSKTKFQFLSTTFQWWILVLIIWLWLRTICCNACFTNDDFMWDQNKLRVALKSIIKLANQKTINLKCRGMLSKQQIIVWWMTNTHSEHERHLLLWNCCGVFFLDKAISSVISAVNSNLLIRFFDVWIQCQVQ